MKRGTKYTTGTGDHWGREVRLDGFGVAWCGQSTGLRDAKRIAAALNRDARQAATIRRLRADVKQRTAERDALGVFVRGMADGYARLGQTRKEWSMRDILARVAALRPAKKVKP